MGAHFANAFPAEVLEVALTITSQVAVVDSMVGILITSLIVVALFATSLDRRHIAKIAVVLGVVLQQMVVVVTMMIALVLGAAVNIQVLRIPK